jgi:hypothetical protein
MKAIASENYRRLKIHEERPLPQGLDAVSFTLAGHWKNWRESRERLVKRSQEIERAIERWSPRTDAAIIEEAARVAPLLLRRTVSRGSPRRGPRLHRPRRPTNAGFEPLPGTIAGRFRPL